jgi:hypothetical protein
MTLGTHPLNRLAEIFRLPFSLPAREKAFENFEKMGQRRKEENFLWLTPIGWN